MPTLLSIPREIRDSIIEHVIFSVREAPPHITAAQSTRSTSENPGKPPPWEWVDNEASSSPATNLRARRWYKRLFGLSSGAEPALTPSISTSEFNVWSTNARWEQTSYKSNSSSLLRVNHQLSSETASALARLTPQSLPYELDVIFFKESELWPTWLYVPVLAKQLEQVNATFRMSGVEEPGKRSVWQRGCGGPPPITWCFYYLLEYVLRRGPVPHTTSPVAKDVSIRILHLNFVGKNDIIEDEELRDPESRHWKYSRVSNHSASSLDEPTQDKVLRPEWCADFLECYMWNLLQMGFFTAQYGAILHERIETILFSINGRRKRSFNVGAILEQLEYRNNRETFGHLPLEERIPAFWKWKENTRRKREELGFRLSEDDPICG